MARSNHTARPRVNRRGPGAWGPVPRLGRGPGPAPPAPRPRSGGHLRGGQPGERVREELDADGRSHPRCVEDAQPGIEGHHTALSTPDLDRLLGFYGELFGFEVELDFPWDETNEAFRATHALPETAGRVVMISNGDSRLEIFEYRKPVPRPDLPGRGHADLGIAHLCFQVTDLAKQHARLAVAGMAFVSGPVEQTPEVANCYGRDPDGNLIELIELRAA